MLYIVKRNRYKLNLQQIAGLINYYLNIFGFACKYNYKNIKPLAQLLSAHAIGAGGLRFKNRVGQIGSVTNGSPPLRRSFGAA